MDLKITFEENKECYSNLKFIDAFVAQLQICEITGNQCGTDAWMVGRPCKCNACQVYLKYKEMLDKNK